MDSPTPVWMSPYRNPWISSRGAKILIGVAVFGLLFSLVWSIFEPRAPQDLVQSQYDHQVMVNGKPLYLELARTDEEIKQGMSDRLSMEPDQGMLFVLGRRDIHPFWMNRMHFSLDIIWLDNGKVVEIAQDLPPPKIGEIPVTYRPKMFADRVLELKAGEAEHYGLRQGVVVPELATEF